MRALSFLPAATEIIKKLDLTDQLAGVTFECPIDRPVVVHSELENETLSSEEINTAVSQAAKAGRSLYTVDLDKVRELAPDVVFTQRVCTICQIGEDETIEALSHLPHPPTVISLSPATLSDVRNDILTVSEALAAKKSGEQLVQEIDQRLEAVRERSPANALRVFFMEWMDPIFHAGHWIPEMIEAAGGYDAFAKKGGKSGTVTLAELEAYDPDLIIAAPCGLSGAEAENELAAYMEKDEWKRIRAVREQQVHVLDAHLFTQPGPDLITGIEQLAEIIEAQPIKQEAK